MERLTARSVHRLQRDDIYTNETHSRANGNSAFLTTLPPEIRNRIYESVLEGFYESVTVRSRSSRHLQCYATAEIDQDQCLPNLRTMLLLARIAKQFSREIMDHVIPHITLTFEDVRALCLFLDQVGPQFKNRMARIAINWSEYPSSKISHRRQESTALLAENMRRLRKECRNIELLVMKITLLPTSSSKSSAPWYRALRKIGVGKVWQCYAQVDHHLLTRRRRVQLQDKIHSSLSRRLSQGNRHNFRPFFEIKRHGFVIPDSHRCVGTVYNDGVLMARAFDKRKIFNDHDLREYSLELWRFSGRNRFWKL